MDEEKKLTVSVFIEPEVLLDKELNLSSLIKDMFEENVKKELKNKKRKIDLNEKIEMKLVIHTTKL